MKVVLFLIGFLALAFLAVQLFAMSSQKDIETYPYTVLETYEDFEIRSYEASLFTSVKLSTKDYEQGSSRCFSSLAGYIVGGKVLVLMNVSDESLAFDKLNIPEGKWKLIANNNGVNTIKGVKDDGTFKKITADTKELILEPTSFKMWVRD